MDRQLVSVLQSLLGHFVEFHLAVMTKYIGFDPDDWIAFGNERTGHRTGKHSGNLKQYFIFSFYLFLKYTVISYTFDIN